MVLYEPHVVALFGAWLAALVLGGAVLWLSPKIRAVAVPNERSSHEKPTPTLGGIAFVVPTLVWLALGSEVFAVQLAGVAGALALLGLMDDLLDLSAWLRLAAQTACVTWFVLAAWPDLSVWLHIVLVFGVLWFINLCNFMDGIDGFLGVQALVFCFGVVLLCGSAMSWSVQSMWILIGGTLGFLSYNWPPAKMFMGDVGSLFLGVVMAAFAVQLALEGVLPLAASVVLLSVFWFDATYTLCVRILTKQRFFDAHRSHLYQRVAQNKGHLWTTTAFLAFAVGYLLPLAWLSVQYPQMQIAIVGVSVLPVAVLAWWMGAGLERGLER